MSRWTRTRTSLQHRERTVDNLHCTKGIAPHGDATRYDILVACAPFFLNLLILSSTSGQNERRPTMYADTGKSAGREGPFIDNQARSLEYTSLYLYPPRTTRPNKKNNPHLMKIRKYVSKQASRHANHKKERHGETTKRTTSIFRFRFRWDTGNGKEARQNGGMKGWVERRKNGRMDGRKSGRKEGT